MSEWNEVKNSDIKINLATKEINFLVSYDKFGNIYGMFTFEQIKSMYEQIKEDI